MITAAEMDSVQPEDDPNLPGSVPSTIKAASASTLDRGMMGSPPAIELSDDSTVSDPVRADALSMVERVRTALYSCVLEFRQHQAQSMSVVIRPDPETAVHLQMHLVESEVRVTAHLELGEFSRFSSHWTELQQTLAAQRIQLSDLSDGSNPLSAFPNFITPQELQPARAHRRSWQSGA
jgi:hypothetical protein